MTLRSMLDSYIGNEPYGIPGSISSLTLADTFAELKAAGLCGIKSKRNGVLQPISQRCVLLSCLRSASVRPSLLSRALSTLTLQKSHPLQGPAYSQILALQELKLLGQRCVLIQNLPASGLTERICIYPSSQGLSSPAQVQSIQTTSSIGCETRRSSSRP